MKITHKQLRSLIRESLTGRRLERVAKRIVYDIFEYLIDDDVQADLKHKIEELESKIDALIEENTMLREKLARMEERLILSASTRATRKRTKKESA